MNNEIEIYHTPAKLSADIKVMADLIKQFNKSKSLIKKIAKADHLDAAKKAELNAKVELQLAEIIGELMSVSTAVGQGDLSDHQEMGKILAKGFFA